MFMTPPLDAKIIQQTLSDYPLEVLCFESLPSTNDYLKKTPTHSPMTLCCAETQTAGRGRLGRMGLTCVAAIYMLPSIEALSFT